MPVRSGSREQAWLLPLSLDEALAADHPVRFVAAFVDSLTNEEWAQFGIQLQGQALGAPSYPPQTLLSIFIYGFMCGVRSTRKLEAACREQLPYWWLTGRQFPDHNTLARFYDSHRSAMRLLLKRTVQTAIRAGLVDLAVQAVDGTKIAANASKSRTYSEEGLKRLLARTEEEIAELEAQSKEDLDAQPARLPKALLQAKELSDKVRSALDELALAEEKELRNLSDRDARLVKSRDGFIAGYNAQIMVSPTTKRADGTSGRIITSTAVVCDRNDTAQLLPMIDSAARMTGQRAGITLADAGYHSGANLAGCFGRGQRVLMPEAQEKALKQPFHQNAFVYDSASDSYTCPQGQTLTFSGLKRRSGRPEVRVYGASPAVCRTCPVSDLCTKNKRHGRLLEVSNQDSHLRRHRALMATEDAQATYQQRKQLPEPVFGILKEQQGARRFLRRGLENVRSEWDLLAAGFNLNTLFRHWKSQPRPALFA